MAEAVNIRSILVGALGGEGGGVLMDWIVHCARMSGLAVQATSVPDVVSSPAIRMAIFAV